jgi:hypothetical protein
MLWHITFNLIYSLSFFFLETAQLSTEITVLMMENLGYNIKLFIGKSLHAMLRRYEKYLKGPGSLSHEVTYGYTRNA